MTRTDPGRQVHKTTRKLPTKFKPSQVGNISEPSLIRLLEWTKYIQLLSMGIYVGDFKKLGKIRAVFKKAIGDLGILAGMPFRKPLPEDKAVKDDPAKLKPSKELPLTEFQMLSTKIEWLAMKILCDKPDELQAVLQEAVKSLEKLAAGFRGKCPSCEFTWEQCGKYPLCMCCPPMD